MNPKFDAWQRSPIRAGETTFVKPGDCIGIPGWSAGVDREDFRRRLKQVDPFLDIMVQMPERIVVILQMDTDPPMRLWTNRQIRPDGGWTTVAVGQPVLDMVQQATWLTREKKAAEIAAINDARIAKRNQDIGEAHRDIMHAMETPVKNYSIPGTKCITIV